MQQIILVALTFVATALLSVYIGLHFKIKRQPALSIVLIIASNIWLYYISKTPPLGISEIFSFVMLFIPNTLLAVISGNLFRTKRIGLAISMISISLLGFLISANSYYRCDVIEASLDGLHDHPFGVSIEKQYDQLQVNNSKIIERIDLLIISREFPNVLDVKIEKTNTNIRSSISITILSEMVGKTYSIVDTLLEKDALELSSMIMQLPIQNTEFTKPMKGNDWSYRFEISSVNYVTGKFRYFDLGNADEFVPVSYRFVKGVLNICKSVQSFDLRELVTEIDKEI